MGAQFLLLTPIFHNGDVVGGARIYHYAAGTSTDLDMWSDKEQTTLLPQPFEADADGVAYGFGEGLYKIVVKDPNDVELYSFDNWRIQDPEDIAFLEGPAIATANTMQIGPEIWAHWTGTNAVTALVPTGEMPFYWAVIDGDSFLIHSANLILPAGIDIALHPNDVVMFLNEGAGKWRLAAHFQADGQLISTQDSRTNTVDVVQTLRSTTSGTPAAGIGIGQLYQAESADETPSDVAQTQAVFSDVTGGSEDSYWEILLRVAGAALSAAYRFMATTGFRAIFTHANSADRTYTLPNGSGTVILHGFNDVGTGDIKTNSDGQATLSSSASGIGASDSDTSNVTMNDYSFFPSLTYSESVSGDATTTRQWQPNGSVSDPATTVGRIKLLTTAVAGTSGESASITTTMRWRYFTGTDDPTMFLLEDQLTGEVIATWFSDDPPPNGELGLVHPTNPARFTTRRLKAADLESWPGLSAKASDAEEWIKARGYKMEHQAMRALQLMTGGNVALWLSQNVSLDTELQQVKIGAIDRAALTAMAKGLEA